MRRPDHLSILFVAFAILGSQSACQSVRRLSQSQNKESASSEVESARRNFGTLLAMRQLIPDVFVRAAKYDIGLNTLLMQQIELVNQLAQFSTYAESAQQRAPLLGLQLSVLSQSQIVTKRLDPARIGQWRNAMKVIQTSLAGVQDAEAVIIQRIGAISLSASGASGLATGLINLISAARRAAIFAMKPADKIAALREELTENMMEKGFDPRRVGVAADRMTKEEALNTLERRFAHETELRNLMMFHVEMQGTEGKLISPEEQAARLMAAGEAELDSVINSEVLKRRLAILEARLKPLGDRIASAAKSTGANAIRRFASDISTSFIEEISAPASNLFLQEVPPQLAYLRGLIAGDCATEYSAGYANSPFERVFFILDDKGETKGYLSTTKTTVAGKPNLYLHTLTGRRISAADASVVLTGVLQNLELFGVNQATVASETQIPKLINFVGPREEVNKVGSSEGSAVVTQTYLDQELRAVIDKASAIPDYDNAAANASARKPGTLPDHVKVKVTKVDSKYEKFQPVKLDRAGAIVLALEFINRNDERGSYRLAEVEWKDPHKLDKLSKGVRNFVGLPLDEYRVRVNLLIEELGGTSGDREWKDNAHIFLFGQLNARDAFSSANLEISVKRFISLLETNIAQAKAVMTSFGRSEERKLLLEHGEIRRFIERANFSKADTPDQLKVLIDIAREHPATIKDIKELSTQIAFQPGEGRENALFVLEEAFSKESPPESSVIEKLVDIVLDNPELSAVASDILVKFRELLTDTQLEKLISRFSSVPEAAQVAILRQVEGIIDRFGEKSLVKMLEVAFKGSESLKLYVLQLLDNVKAPSSALKGEIKSLVLGTPANSTLYIYALSRADSMSLVDHEVALHLFKYLGHSPADEAILYFLSKYRGTLPEFDEVLAKSAKGEGLRPEDMEWRMLCLSTLSKRRPGAQPTLETAAAVIRIPDTDSYIKSQTLEMKALALRILYQADEGQNLFGDFLAEILETNGKYAEHLLAKFDSPISLTKAQSDRIAKVSGANKEVAERVLKESTLASIAQSGLPPKNCLLLLSRRRNATR